MKILQLCHKPPFPELDGGSIAMNNISNGLIHLGHQVKVLAISTLKHPIRNNDEFNQYKAKTNFESVFVDTSITPMGVLKSFLFNYSYHIKRFDSKDFHQKLASLLTNETFDVIQLETIYMAPYIKTIRANSEAKIVARLHNIEHKIWERLVDNEKNLLKKGALKWMTHLLKKYEFSVFDQIDAFMPISDVDAHYFNSLDLKIDRLTIPFGIDIDKYQLEDDYIPSENPDLFHIGSMNWLPNVEGIEWFLDKVWAKVITNYPKITFSIAGRNIPDRLLHRQTKNLFIEGEVPDAQRFMNSKDIMIVPLLSGSGVRVKIIEGMALGKTIISTSIGAEGLDVVDGKHILIANTPEEMIEAIGQCVKSPDICKFIGQSARHYVSLHHNNETISHKIIAFYNSLCNIN
jgi:glycosyltransferase involved in cell wall biosynthesis